MVKIINFQEKGMYSEESEGAFKKALEDFKVGFVK